MFPVIFLFIYLPLCVQKNELFLFQQHDESIDTKDRIAQFVDGSTSYAARYIQQRNEQIQPIGDGRTKRGSKKSKSKSSKTFRFAVDERAREIFLMEIALAKDKTDSFGFLIQLRRIFLGHLTLSYSITGLERFSIFI